MRDTRLKMGVTIESKLTKLEAANKEDREGTQKNGTR